MFCAPATSFLLGNGEGRPLGFWRGEGGVGSLGRGLGSQVHQCGRCSESKHEGDGAKGRDGIVDPEGVESDVQDAHKKPESSVHAHNVIGHTGLTARRKQEQSKQTIGENFDRHHT